MPTVAQPIPRNRKPGPKVVDWDSIKAEMIAGVPSPEVGEKYGVDPATIRGRASDEQWPTPHRLAKAARKARKAIQDASQLRQSTALSTPATNPPPTSQTDSVALSMADVGARNAMVVGREAARLLAAAVAQRTLPVPESWKEATAAFALVEKASGRDKPSTAIQVNIGGAWGSSGAGFSPDDLLGE